jgi:hypothetical protein
LAFAPFLTAGASPGVAVADFPDAAVLGSPAADWSLQPAEIAVIDRMTTIPDARTLLRRAGYRSLIFRPFIGTDGRAGLGREPWNAPGELQRHSRSYRYPEMDAIKKSGDDPARRGPW